MNVFARASDWLFPAERSGRFDMQAELLALADVLDPVDVEVVKVTLEVARTDTETFKQIVRDITPIQRKIVGHIIDRMSQVPSKRAGLSEGLRRMLMVGVAIWAIFWWACAFRLVRHEQTGFRWYEGIHTDIVLMLLTGAMAPFVLAIAGRALAWVIRGFAQSKTAPER